MEKETAVLLKLKFALLSKGVRQTRMAVELGWDPAKLSRIVNQTIDPTPQERNAISEYLRVPESKLFSSHKPKRKLVKECGIEK